MTDTVNNLFITQKIIEGKKVKSYKLTKKRLEKINEKKKETSKAKDVKKEEPTFYSTQKLS